MIERSRVRVPARAAGEFSSPGSTFCAVRLLLRCPLHPSFTAVARKLSRSFCQKCGWQVTAKHTCIVLGTPNLRRDDSSFTWHESYVTTGVTNCNHFDGHYKTHCVKLQSFIQSRIQLEHSGSARKQTIAL